MQFRAFLELIRLPATFTSPADSLAGYALALFLTQQSIHPKYPLFAILISACVYGAGMICNDIFDLQIDLVQRPNRPIPSGRVPRIRAWAWAFALQITACILAISISPQLFDATLITILLTYLYNGLVKEIKVLGPLVMGLCRLGNFMIGYHLIASIAASDLIPNFFYSPWLLGGITALYVFALTLLSKFEVQSDQTQVGSARIAFALMVSLSALPLISSLIRIFFYDINRPMFSLKILAIVVSILPIFILINQGSALLKNQQTQDKQIQSLVMLGIRNLLVLNLTTTMIFAQYHLAILLIVFLLMSFKVGKWFYGT